MTDIIESPEAENQTTEQDDAARVAEKKTQAKRKRKRIQKNLARYNSIKMPKLGEKLIEQISPVREGVSVPAYKQKVSIKSLQAQKVMRRVFSRASGSMYRIDVILRIIGSDKAAAEVEQIINDSIEKAEQDIEQARTRFEILLDNNCITELPTYEAVYTDEIKVLSPHAGRFLTLVRKLDDIVGMIDALWLSGLLMNKDRNMELFKWQQMIIGLGAKIIAIENRSRDAARRQGKGDEVDKNAPEDNSKVVDSVEKLDEEEESKEENKDKE